MFPKLRVIIDSLSSTRLNCRHTLDSQEPLMTLQGIVSTLFGHSILLLLGFLFSLLSFRLLEASPTISFRTKFAGGGNASAFRGREEGNSFPLPFSLAAKGGDYERSFARLLLLLLNFSRAYSSPRKGLFPRSNARSGPPRRSLVSEKRKGKNALSVSFLYSPPSPFSSEKGGKRRALHFENKEFLRRSILASIPPTLSPKLPPFLQNTPQR